MKERTDAWEIRACSPNRAVHPRQPAGRADLVQAERHAPAQHRHRVPPGWRGGHLHHGEPDEVQEPAPRPSLLGAGLSRRLVVGVPGVRGQGGSHPLRKHRPRGTPQGPPIHLQRHHAAAQRGLGRVRPDHGGRQARRDDPAARPCVRHSPGPHARGREEIGGVHAARLRPLDAMADALKSALDRMELNELMNRYAASIDLRDWTRLRSVFVDGEIEADFTTMGVRQVFRGPAEAWVDLVRQTITGFDATQHFFANHSAEVEGDRAVDTRYMQARHQLGDAHYTIGGYYTGQMLRTAAGWRVARYTLTVTFTDGERRA